MSEVGNMMPVEHTLEYGMGQLQNILDDKLMDLAAEQAGSLIDLREEADRWLERSYLADRRFGFYYLGIDYQDDPQAREVVIRAAKFALQVVGDIAATQPEIDIAGYLEKELPDNPYVEREDALRQNVQEYFNDRPALDVFTEWYAEEVAGEPRYFVTAQTVCGLMFIISEEAIANLYVTERFHNVSIEDFIAES